MLHYPRIQDKYGLTEDVINGYLLAVQTHGTLVTAPSFQGTLCEDADDDKFLICALAGGAQYVVSGDPDLLNMNGFAGISILTPRDFVAGVLDVSQPALPGIL